MKRLIIAIGTMLLSLNVGAQDITVDEGVLIADDTRMYDKGRFPGHIKIVTCNQDIANQLIYWYFPCECISYSCRFVEHRLGSYPEWTIIIPSVYKEQIVGAYDYNVPKKEEDGTNYKRVKDKVRR